MYNFLSSREESVLLCTIHLFNSTSSLLFASKFRVASKIYSNAAESVTQPQNCMHILQLLKLPDEVIPRNTSYGKYIPDKDL